MTSVLVLVTCLLRDAGNFKVAPGDPPLLLINAVDSAGLVISASLPWLRQLLVDAAGPDIIGVLRPLPKVPVVPPLMSVLSHGGRPLDSPTGLHGGWIAFRPLPEVPIVPPLQSVLRHGGSPLHGPTGLHGG